MERIGHDRAEKRPPKEGCFPRQKGVFFATCAILRFSPFERRRQENTRLKIFEFFCLTRTCLVRGLWCGLSWARSTQRSPWARCLDAVFSSSLASARDPFSGVPRHQTPIWLWSDDFRALGSSMGTSWWGARLRLLGGRGGFGAHSPLATPCCVSWHLRVLDSPK